jgi:hypothetical protein
LRLLNLRVRPALFILVVMNAVFILALASVVQRGLDIDCGCFNPEPGASTSPTAAIVRDFGFVVLIVTAWFFKPERKERAHGD